MDWQADFYQMFAYGQKYLGGNGEMYLITLRMMTLANLDSAAFCFLGDFKIMGCAIPDNGKTR
ncbi:hypothetical protein ACLB1T_15590 [Escherichia coli]